MKAHAVLRNAVLALIAISFGNFGCNRGQNTSTEHFVITDLVPKACLENSTQTRTLITLGDDGKLHEEVQWPTQRTEELFGGMRIALGEGSSPFHSPPQELKVAAPSPGFSAGMLSPDWFDGAVHIFTGNATINQYEFQGDKDYPLTFKVVKGQGYVCLCGKGTVTEKGQIPTQLGEKDSIAYWTARSTSQDELVREGCAQALGYLELTSPAQEREQARKTLFSFLTDNSYEVRRNTIEALVRIGATVEVASVLKEMAEKDDNEWVKACAKWATEQTPKK